jgi:hypothetical protein
MEFQGSIQELQAMVEEMGISGHWNDEGVFHMFRADDGAVLNWWPKTHVLSFQGRPDKRQHLLELFETKLETKSRTIGADLQSVIDAWPTLPDAIRTSILTMINAVHPGKSNTA